MSIERMSLAADVLLIVTGALGVLLFALLGAAWRRWLGAAGTGPRWLKMLVGWALAALALLACGLPLAFAAGVAAFLAIGWSFGHVFDPWWPLLPRYGATTLAVGLLLWSFGQAWGLAYAPLGLLAPLGYVAARRLGVICWTCAGEAWLGALVYGGLPAAALLAR